MDREKIKLVGGAQSFTEREINSKAGPVKLFETTANIVVNGESVGNAKVGCWGEKAKEQFLEQKELDGSHKEYNGKTSYTVFAARESSGGGRSGGGFRPPADPVAEAYRQRLIVAQNSLTNAVAFVTCPDRDVQITEDNVIELAEKFMNAVLLMAK